VVRLAADGKRLSLLGRVSGTVLELDVTDAKSGKLAIKKTYAPWFEEKQLKRRLGEVVYRTDFGSSRMTCDTCHPDGHSGGIMFSKGQPIRIYRAPTLRGIRESPPYFTPAKLSSIRRTSRQVLARNRFFNPKPTKEETDEVTEFTGSVAVPPNPNLGPHGELPRALVLPDGARGDAMAGLALFESRGCASATCHPPPSFTADQVPATRGILHQLATPIALMLRPELQDLQTDYGQPAPSLLGVWDNFPLFLSGAGGNNLESDGTVVAKTPFALREVLENPAWARHGEGPSMTPAERNDLLAYLLTL
jgi:cytochrome c peroxidase